MKDMHNVLGAEAGQFLPQSIIGGKPPANYQVPYSQSNNRLYQGPGSNARVQNVFSDRKQ